MKRSWSWVVGAVISVAALVVVFWGLRPPELLASLQAGHYLFVLPAAAMLCLGLMARAKSWHTLLDTRVSYWRAFQALNEGYLLNNVLPFRLGEVGRAYLVSRGPGLSGSRALSSVVVERLIDLLLSVSVLLISLPFALSAAWARDAARASVVLVVGLYLGFFVLLAQRTLVLRLARWSLDHLPRPHAMRWAVRAESFMDGLEALRDGRRLLGAMFWSAVAWLTYGLQVYFLLRVFFPAPSLEVIGLLLGVTAIGAAVPSSPGAVGVFEASAVAALLAFDYPRPPALSFAVTLHLLVLTVTCVLGAAALAREGESLLTVAHSARTYFRGVRETSPTLD